MRSPHRIAQPSPEPSAYATTPHPSHVSPEPYEPYHEPYEPRYTNPYEELAGLADNPLDDVLRYEDEAEDAPGHEAGFDPDEPWAPPNHRRGRRWFRLAGLPFAIKASIAILTLIAFLALGDRWAVLFAEHEAAEKIKDAMHLEATPEVDIGGFPFVTQLARKRLDSVTVTVPDVAADRVSLAKVSATAENIRIDADLPSTFRSVDVGRVHGEVLLSFDDLNRELGASQVTFTGTGPQHVLARGTVPVAGHDLRVRADATLARSGDRGVDMRVGGMQLTVGDLATFRPGTKRGDGLHLTEKSARAVQQETDKIKAMFEVPAMVDRLGVPKDAVRTALDSDEKLHELTGTPRFLHQLMDVNLIDAALDHPELLRRLGFDPALLTGLSELTRPQLADELSLGFQLPKIPSQSGDVSLKDVRVEKTGIRVDLSGQNLGFGTK
ncbi:LmeA family phospholipid-binding protein [Streptomyces sp. NPDC049954]|uniref:LmeA family phospholipid-binding protein n=1 Tax=Streptomyces sp. NPDC049954 TaxID=3155779 RepID=UPI00344127A3